MAAAAAVAGYTQIIKYSSLKNKFTMLAGNNYCMGATVNSVTINFAEKLSGRDVARLTQICQL